MKIKGELMWFLKFILSLLHVFYVGIIIVICLILGLFNPMFLKVAGILFVGWMIYGVIDQIVLAKVMRDSPELQEVINSVVANYPPRVGRIPDGEVSFCELQGQDKKLVGRCLNFEEERWSIRLLYDDSYQILDWNLVYNEKFMPQMIVAEGENIPEGSVWVKCYEKNEDGVARWNLHLLYRQGAIYKDVKLNFDELIVEIDQNYVMGYVDEHKVIILQTKEDAKDIFLQQTIGISNEGMGVKPIDIGFGQMSMLDLEKSKFYLSVGPRYEEFGGGDVAGYYVTGNYYYDSANIHWKDVCIEDISEKKK